MHETAIVELGRDLKLSIRVSRQRRQSVQLASGDAYRLGQALLDYADARADEEREQETFK